MMMSNQTPEYTTTTSFFEIWDDMKKMKTGGPGFIHSLDRLRKELAGLYTTRLDKAMVTTAMEAVNESAGVNRISVMQNLQGYVQPQAVRFSENADASLADAENIEALVQSDMLRVLPPCSQDGALEGITIAEMQPILRLHGIFIEGATLKVATFAYVRAFRDWLMTTKGIGEALITETVSPRKITEPWPYPSFMGPRCSAESNRRQGILV